MKKYKIGLIGYGGFGMFLHHWWSKLKDVEVVAIAYSDHPPKDVGNCKIFDDWKKLIADPEIDIVSIVTPPSLHAEMACAGMRAGKHVLLEKPVALTKATAREIMEVQRETGMIITVNHMIRYNPIIEQLVKIERSGSLGKLRHATVNNYAQDASLPQNHWFWDEEQSGGILVEHGVHFFDIVNALSDQRYVDVCGFSHSRNDVQRDRMAATVLYDQGLIASYYHAFSGPGFFEETKINLAFDLARIEIEGWIPLHGKVTALVTADVKRQLESLPGFKIISSEPLGKVNDASRPEGWGSSDETQDQPKVETAYYEMLVGEFKISESKGEVYGASVQAILLDLIQKIEDDNHKLRITLEDAVTALDIALLASN